MKIVTYDCEVFEGNWLITFKDKESGIYTCIWAASIDFTGFTTVFLFSNSQRRGYSMNWACSLLVFEIMSKCPAYFAWRASTSAFIAGSFSSRSNPRKTKNIRRLIAIGRKLENP